MQRWHSLQDGALNSAVAVRAAVEVTIGSFGGILLPRRRHLACGAPKRQH
jgi:hypothetical protein